MKKFLALLMAAMMLLSCVAFAEEAKDPMEIDRAITTKLESHWVGNWTLANAWIGEEFIDDYGVEGVEAGLIEVKPGAITMTIEALLNHCASDKSLGQIVDQAAYLHAHVYCLGGTIAFADYPDEEYTIKNEWDEYAYVVRGEMDGDFNYGPAKVNIKGEDDYIYWNDLTGFDFEEIEEFKYIGMNKDGQIVITACDKNIATKEKAEIWFAYIFDKVVAE